jgi:hypothetical protein
MDSGKLSIFLELREGRRCQKGTQAIAEERFINKKLNKSVGYLVDK